MTLSSRLLPLVLLCSLAPGSAVAQWRRLGNAAIEIHASGVATGPMDRVAFSQDGTRLFARSTAGQWFATRDLESWSSEVAPKGLPEPLTAVPDRLPESGALVRATYQPGTLYAAGEHAWRSDDGGRSWSNLTQRRSESVLGARVADLTVSPGDPEEIAVATGSGVWRSADGGRSWSSCNAALPHLPLRRILSVPVGTAGARVSFVSPDPARRPVFEWQPGERLAWRRAAPVDSEVPALARRLSAPVTVVERAAEFVYAGSSDGRLWVSLNGGVDWANTGRYEGSSVESIAVDSADPRRAVVGLSRSAGQPAGPVVLRTLNGGIYWDDATGNLPAFAAFGVTAEFRTGALYVATLEGIFQADLNAPSWTRLTTDLPEAAIVDVRLDPSGNQLYAAVYGYGLYTAIAPHRRRDIQVVHAADYGIRPAAPGALLTILGVRAEDVRAGDSEAAILPSTETETHLQVPYSVTGPGLRLSFVHANQRFFRSMPLVSASPAIFVDPDGSPMALDAETGVLIDRLNPAHAGMTIQVLASGLGRVSPDWPAGRPAPLENLPKVVAPVKASLNGTPLEVVRATLAPGYIGFYLVEVKLPSLVDRGPADFVLETGNITSNRVRLHVEP